MDEEEEEEEEEETQEALLNLTSKQGIFARRWFYFCRVKLPQRLDQRGREACRSADANSKHLPSCQSGGGLSCRISSCSVLLAASSTCELMWRREGVGGGAGGRETDGGEGDGDGQHKGAD